MMMRTIRLGTEEVRFQAEMCDRLRCPTRQQSYPLYLFEECPTVQVTYSTSHSSLSAFNILLLLLLVSCFSCCEGPGLRSVGPPFLVPGFLLDFSMLTWTRGDVDILLT